MTQWMPLLVKFIKFCVVGTFVTGLDFGMTFTYKEKLKLNPYLANALSFIVAVSLSFYLNRIWTFHNNAIDVYAQLMRFTVVAAAGLGINTLSTWFFTEKRKYNFYFSKALATGIVIFWNFLMNMLFTFAK